MIGRMAEPTTEHTMSAKHDEQQEEGRRKAEEQGAGVDERGSAEDGRVGVRGDDAAAGWEADAVAGRRRDKGKETLLPPNENLFRTLPTEIVVRILAHLTPHELVQSASCCREWYFIASDPLLWRTLDLSLLQSKLFNPNTAVTLTARLKSCRTFTLREPKALTQQHVTALLHYLAASPLLERLYLQSMGTLLNSHSLEHHFRVSQSRCLMHVDLSHSHVTTPAVVTLMDRHRGTLRTLDLSHTAIGDGTLRAVSTAKALHTLDISSCTSVSRTSIRNFLCKRFPGCLVTLSLRGLREVKITWLYDLMKLPTSSNLRVLNVEGCERLSLGDLTELQEAFSGRVEIRHDARAEDDSVWGYRKYIEFLSTDPTLPERLCDEVEKGKGKEKEGHGPASWSGSGSGSGGDTKVCPRPTPRVPSHLPPPPRSTGGSTNGRGALGR